ncbi:MAG: ParB N-terminal domain-containing protein [Phycisphaerales bacterium]|nr:ParB N-terminal domain-containing protein [Phycisphaerales bacterium]
MEQIPIELLRDHPENANQLSRARCAALRRHIGRTGRYPPVIVRPHADHTVDSPVYEIIDGHHRVRILRGLGHTHVSGVVWDVADDDVRLLLLTLNRLTGEDDPERRSLLIQSMVGVVEAEELAALLPETRRQIVAACRSAAQEVVPIALDLVSEAPHAVTFFLTREHRERLLHRLRGRSPDLNQALVELLELDVPA